MNTISYNSISKLFVVKKFCSTKVIIVFTFYPKIISCKRIKKLHNGHFFELVYIHCSASFSAWPHVFRLSCNSNDF